MHVVVDRKLVRHHPGTASQGEPDAGPHVGLMEQGSPKPLRPRAAVQGYLPARTRDHRKVRAPPSRQKTRNSRYAITGDHGKDRRPDHWATKQARAPRRPLTNDRCEAHRALRRGWGVRAAPGTNLSVPPRALFRVRRGYLVAPTTSLAPTPIDAWCRWPLRRQRRLFRVDTHTQFSKVDTRPEIMSPQRSPKFCRGHLRWEDLNANSHIDHSQRRQTAH